MRNRNGFTMIELLIAVAILGILLGIAAAFIRTPTARVLSNDLRAMISQARFEAIKRNVPVAVVWDSSRRTFSTRVDHDGLLQCDENVTQILRTLELDSYQRANVSVNMPGNGVVWLPNTRLRTCSGQSLSQASIDVSDSRNSVQLRISSSGQVSLQ